MGKTIMDLDIDYRRKVALFVVLIVIFMFISIFLILKFCACCAHVGDNIKGGGFFNDFEAMFMAESSSNSRHSNKEHNNHNNESPNHVNSSLSDYSNNANENSPRI